MDVRNVSLSFGGVRAITDISFDVKVGEIRAIIGPNGAGKTSMLNVINGFYTPQQGTIWFHGKERKGMKPHHAVRQGIARTFQNVALFKGMSTLDNIMTGRSVHMHRNLFWQMLWHGPALAEEIEHREKVEEIIDFLEIQHIRRTPVGKLPYGLQKRVELGRALAMEPSLLLARRADGRHESRGEGGHEPLHHRREPAARHHHRTHRTRHGRGHGPFGPRRRSRLRREDRRRHARSRQVRQPGHRRLSRRSSLKRKETDMVLSDLALTPLISLIAGVLILIMPRLLNYIVALYLIVIGLLGLFPNILH